MWSTRRLDEPKKMNLVCGGKSWRVAQHISRMSGRSCSTRLLIPQSTRLSCTLSQLSKEQGWHFTSFQEESSRRIQHGDSSATVAARISRGLYSAMASSVVKRIPLIRFPARMRSPAAPPPASAPAAAASSELEAESKTPPTAGVDAVGSSRPLHSSVPSQKPSAGGVA